MSPGDDKGKKIKVACHGCGARYQVSSGKVRGRRFRATCKRCGGIIVARCTDAFSVLPEDKAKSKARARAGKKQKAKEASPDPSWYVVISGKPHGPLTPDDLRQSFDARKISERSYIWKAGDQEWRRLEDVEQFSDLLEETTNFYRVNDQDISDDEETISGGPGGEPEEEGHPAFRKAVTSFPEMGEDEEDLTEETAVHFNKQDKEEPDEATQHRFEPELAEPGGGDDGLPGGTDPFSEAVGEPYGDDRAEEDEHFDAPEHLPEPGGWGQPAVEWGPADELWPSGPVISARKAFLPMPTGRPRLLKLFVDTLIPSRQPPPMPGASTMVDEDSSVEIIDPSSSAVEILSSEPVPLAPAQPLDPLPVLPGPPPPAPPPVVNGAMAAPLVSPAMMPSTTMVTTVGAFWTKGKIAAAAAICGGLGVAAAVILGVVLARSQPAELPKKGAAKEVAVALKEQAPEEKAPRKKVVKVAAPAPAPVPRVPQPAPAPPETTPKKQPSPGVVEAPTSPAAVPTPPPAAEPAKVQREPHTPKASVRLVKKPRKAKRRYVRRPRRAPRRSSRDVDSLLMGSSSRRKRKRAAPPADDGVDGILAAGRRRKRKRASSSSGDGVDGILAAGRRRTSRATLPRKPTKAQIRNTMRNALPRVSNCYDRYRQSGMIKVLVRVSPSGRPDARVVGSFRGTSTAECVLTGVSKLRFPRFSGPSFSFTYPFRLR